jgi:hypothetical protein
MKSPITLKNLHDYNEKREEFQSYIRSIKTSSGQLIMDSKFKTGFLVYILDWMQQLLWQTN